MTLSEFQKLDRYEALARTGGRAFVDSAAAKRAAKGPIGPSTQRRITRAREIAPV